MERFLSDKDLCLERVKRRTPIKNSIERAKYTGWKENWRNMRGANEILIKGEGQSTLLNLLLM